MPQHGTGACFYKLESTRPRVLDLRHGLVAGPLAARLSHVSTKPLLSMSFPHAWIPSSHLALGCSRGLCRLQSRVPCFPILLLLFPWSLLPRRGWWPRPTHTSGDRRPLQGPGFPGLPHCSSVPTRDGLPCVPGEVPVPPQDGCSCLLLHRRPTFPMAEFSNLTQDFHTF